MKFHERFNIEIGAIEAQRRFLNRVKSMIIDEFMDIEEITYVEEELEKIITIQLGDTFENTGQLDFYYSNDFYKCLRTLEILHSALSVVKLKHLSERLSDYIKSILKMSEFDLGIEWKNGAFFRKGAKLLDDKLVNDSLEWLKNKNYISVLKPFTDGLTHFIEAEKKPILLKSVIIEMYEATEAISKIITKRDSKDLAANKDLFIKILKVSEEYKPILKEYISYANKYRHAATQENEKPKLSISEVESFIYLTGLFIRLCTKVNSD